MSVGSDVRGHLGQLTNYERSRNMLANSPTVTSASSFVALASERRAVRASRTTMPHLRARSSPPKCDYHRLSQPPFIDISSAPLTGAAPDIITKPPSPRNTVPRPPAPFTEDKVCRKIEFVPADPVEPDSGRRQAQSRCTKKRPRSRSSPSKLMVCQEASLRSMAQDENDPGQPRQKAECIQR